MVEMAAPIDQVKSKKAEERVAEFRSAKELEKDQEASELAQRQAQSNLQVGAQASLEQRDVGTEPGSGSPTRNPKSRSNVSAIQQCIEVVGYMAKRGDFD